MFATRRAPLALWPVVEMERDAGLAPGEPGGHKGFSLAINVERRELVDATVPR